jgi:acyl-CoA thioesterase II
MNDAAAPLLRLLQVERIDGDLFRGEQPTSGKHRMFGGQVLAQALAAGYSSVPPDRHLHSLHSYFILPGDTAQTVLFEVERLRDGRSFTTRRIAAIQNGRPIFYMTASFQTTESGPDHQDSSPSPGIDPDLLPAPAEFAAARGTVDGARTSFGSIDIRTEGYRDALSPSGYPSVSRVWMKVSDRLPDDQAIHASALAYMSDFVLLRAAMAVHGLEDAHEAIQTASLDHAMWYHRPLRADEWLLYDQVSPSTSGARGLAMSRIFDLQGRLVATAMQEGLLRPTRPRG